jgi:UDP-N-acetylmuramoyl-L-alanyl-D-glutamate--2,6-diaminopimelate ligase
VDPFDSLAAQGAMIERLGSDSRRMGPGAAFFAYPGEGADGRAHIPDALARGASAVVWEKGGEQADFAWKAEWRVPNVAVRGLKHQAGALADAFYGRPSAALWVCGVTGTNGKTSCSQWIAAALGRRGEKTAVMGTLGAGFPGSLAPLPNTTPDALEVHRLLRQFARDEAKAVAMEVSSHGLVQGRVNGVAFDCALFTNLSHDHLDYHGTMDAYADAKARLFDWPGLEAAVLNLDDPVGSRLARRLKGRGPRLIGYGFAEKAPAAVDEYLPASLLDKVESGQVGRFNLSNVLGVLGCLLAHGIARREALELVSGLPPVPGRMEKIGERPLVLVDYAHTPDALEKVLLALRPVAQARGGRLAVVFGAGGNRDAAKRPLMGAVASRLADRAFVTSDNPRGEDPLAIIAQIAKGMAGHETEPDRARAIEAAVAGAAPEDVILVAGKGHEDYQEIAGRRLPFSDAAVARAALARRSAA